MHQIKDLFGTYKLVATKSGRTERGDLITEFTERLNIERGERKLLTVGGVAFFLSPFKVPDLYLLLKKCNEAKAFSAVFWYHAKPKAKSPITRARAGI